MITIEQKRELLELKQKAEDAKAALNEAVEAVANDHEIDKGVLNKCVTGWFKGDAWKLRAGAQLTLDLLEDGYSEKALRNHMRSGERVGAETH